MATGSGSGDLRADHDEIAYILEGEVEITTEEGDVLRVAPGDILITPKGSRGTWDAKSPVRKFWAIFKR